MNVDESEREKNRIRDEKITKIISIEEKNEGSISWDAYTFFIRSGGYWFFLGLMIFALFSQVLTLLASYWLAHWGEVANYAELSNKPLSSNENVVYLNTYALLGLMGIVALVIRSLFLAHLRIGTSLILHAGILKSTLDAPVAFFDITPLGRILNRFSSDMLTVDEELSQSVMQLSNSSFQTLGGFAAIAGATNGTFLAFLLPIIYFYFRLNQYFRKSNTALARLESVSRSPIYADFSQALVGANSIRAYRDQHRFIEQLEKRLNINTTVLVLQQLGGCWLALRLDFLGSLISFFVAVIAVATLSTSFISAGFLGLGLSYSFQLVQYLKFTTRIAATLEAQMNSVERIKFYMENIVAEEPDLDKCIMPPANWPEKGVIQGSNVKMRYRDGPLVLKSVDFTIGASEKVGIAGRTGSGKSSLMVALFRIQEVAGGKVFIDGVDCATVPLHVLRSKLGIIPQDAVMFSASVRFNLDPFSEHSDADVWEVLRNVDMDHHVQTLPSKLEELVAEGGDNFSAGQRQLICIARALLRKPKILVMDEATASVDNDTDALIQSMVRDRFKDATVLTIAHRLHTIIDYDKIMVLDSGRLVEMDSPANLLANNKGRFRALWDRHQKSHGLHATSSKSSLRDAGEEAAGGGQKRHLNKINSVMVFEKTMEAAGLRTNAPVETNERDGVEDHDLESKDI
jgi:ATP-binding cassette subfamily C (CFTR/MRP) protein 1